MMTAPARSRGYLRDPGEHKKILTGVEAAFVIGCTYWEMTGMVRRGELPEIGGGRNYAITRADAEAARDRHQANVARLREQREARRAHPAPVSVAADPLPLPDVDGDPVPAGPCCDISAQLTVLAGMVGALCAMWSADGTKPQ